MMETMAAAAAVPQDLFCAMIMMLPVVMPFVQGILFSMCLVNLQETQVVCHQKHPCFEGHTRVGIISETMVVAAENLLCAMMITMPLVMPFFLACPVWHAPGELGRDSGSMSLGTSLLQGSHLGSNCTGNDEGSCQRSALPDEYHDQDATDDALHLGRPVQHVPGELARDSGSMPLGTSML
jgi:hypothetical protein